jgi:hypothetical protein
MVGVAPSVVSVIPGIIPAAIPAETIIPGIVPGIEPGIIESRVAITPIRPEALMAIQPWIIPVVVI